MIIRWRGARCAGEEVFDIGFDTARRLVNTFADPSHNDILRFTTLPRNNGSVRVIALSDRIRRSRTAFDDQTSG